MCWFGCEVRPNLGTDSGPQQSTVDQISAITGPTVPVISSVVMVSKPETETLAFSSVHTSSKNLGFCLKLTVF